MCNWGWLAGPVGGLIVDREKKKKKEAQRQSALANQRLQEGLANKEKENSDTLDNVNKAVDTDPIRTMDSMTNTSLTPKRTISTLSLPFRRNGLNVR